MRCPRCGNENQTTNRFCGMCGATLLQADSPTSAAQSTVAQGASSPIVAAPAVASTTSPAASRSSVPASEEAPVISGPSFLGLNDPVPSSRQLGSLSIDPRNTTSSRNLDYLLEDDEEPKHGGAGKWLLILVALALAVGFGYLRWKDQGFNWLNTGAKKPTPAVTTDGDNSTASTPANTPAPSPNSAANSPAPSPNSAANPPANAAASQPATNATSPTPNPATSNTPAPNSSTSTPAATAPTDGNAPATNTAATPAPGAPASSSPAGDAPNSGAGSPSTSSTATKGSSDDAASDSPVNADKPKPAPVAPSKPAAAIRPARAIDPVTEAEKYIYGKGVQQDCDRGMRILKPAADQSNPKAMVEMGALYSAGLCTPRDLPTAYRWFALALRKDPDNQSVQADLQKLWGEMTQPERQLAIRLSQ